MTFISVLLIVFLSGRFRSENVALSGLACVGLGQFFGLHLLPDLSSLWLGFSSNAVITLVSVMLLSIGLQATGVMESTSRFIVRASREKELWAVVLLMACAGISSAVIQNAAVVVLFLPVASVVAHQFNSSISRFAMPIAIAATAGGTMTMVSTAPLILVQSLLPSSYAMMPFGATLGPGFLILICAIIIQSTVGHRLLPKGQRASSNSRSEFYRITSRLHGIRIDDMSPYVGRPFGLFERKLGIIVAGYFESGRWIYTPYRRQLISSGMTIAIFATNEDINRIVNFPGIRRAKLRDRAFASATADFVEMLVPARSTLSGKRIRQISIRKNYGVAPLAVYSNGQIMHDNLRAYRLKGGDIIFGYSSWGQLKRSYRPNDLLLLGSLQREYNRAKAPHALIAIALSGLAITFGIPSSLAFGIGVGWMIWFSLFNLNDVLREVNWATVALLGAMIPIGSMVSFSGTAHWLSVHLNDWLGHLPFFQLSLILVAVSLVAGMAMTNVGAATVLIPLAVQLGLAMGVEAHHMAIAVALAVSNTFMLSSSQVNMLVLSPGKYTNADYIKLGSIHTISYGLIVVFSLYLGWL